MSYIMIIHSNIICCYKVYVHAAISEPIDEDTTILFFFVVTPPLLQNIIC
jgi:hypothetical protein